MNFYKSLKLFVILQLTTGCQNGQIPQFNSLEEAVQFAEENDIPLEDLPYRKWNRSWEQEAADKNVDDSYWILVTICHWQMQAFSSSVLKDGIIGYRSLDFVTNIR